MWVKNELVEIKLLRVKFKKFYHELIDNYYLLVEMLTTAINKRFRTFLISSLLLIQILKEISSDPCLRT